MSFPFSLSRIVAPLLHFEISLFGAQLEHRWLYIKTPKWVSTNYVEIMKRRCRPGLNGFPWNVSFVFPKWRRPQGSLFSAFVYTLLRGMKRKLPFTANSIWSLYLEAILKITTFPLSIFRAWGVAIIIIRACDVLA